RLFAIADIAELHRPRTSCNAHEDIVAGRTGVGLQLGAHHRHTGAGECELRGGIGHATDQGAGGLGLERRGGKERDRGKEKHPAKSADDEIRGKVWYEHGGVAVVPADLNARKKRGQRATTAATKT